MSPVTRQSCGLRTLIVTAAPCLDRAPCGGGFYAGNTQIDNTAGDGDESAKLAKPLYLGKGLSFQAFRLEGHPLTFLA